MNHALRFLFFALVVRPLVYVVLGLNVRGRESLPADGPAIVCANHNSHLDTMVLISLFPLKMLRRIRPVAAADYFLGSPLLAWFSLNILGIVPLDREARQKGEDPLATSREALDRGDILVDGGVMNNLPVDVMQTFYDGGVIIAVNLKGTSSLPSDGLSDTGVMPGWGPMARRFNPLVETPDLPGIVDILLRSTETGTSWPPSGWSVRPTWCSTPTWRSSVCWLSRTSIL